MNSGFNYFSTFLGPSNGGTFPNKEVVDREVYLDKGTLVDGGAIIREVDGGGIFLIKGTEVEDGETILLIKGTEVACVGIFPNEGAHFL